MRWEPVIAVCRYMSWGCDEYFDAPGEMVDAIRARMAAGFGMPRFDVKT